MWNARSQAANHGYSHLSGIEMMSRLKRCFHSRVASEMSLRRWRRLRRITRQPFANHIVVKLFAPKQTGVTLTRDLFRLFVRFCRRDRIVKFVRLLDALREHGIKVAEGLCRRFIFR